MESKIIIKLKKFFNFNFFQFYLPAYVLSKSFTIGLPGLEGGSNSFLQTNDLIPSNGSDFPSAFTALTRARYSLYGVKPVRSNLSLDVMPAFVHNPVSQSCTSTS